MCTSHATLPARTATLQNGYGVVCRPPLSPERTHLATPGADGPNPQHYDYARRDRSTVNFNDVNLALVEKCRDPDRGTTLFFCLGARGDSSWAANESTLCGTGSAFQASSATRAS